MSSITTVLQFCIVVLHCTFIYVFFNIIAMIDSLLLRIAGKPIGQVFFWAADCVMSLLINAATYPINKQQNFSTTYFLPAFIIVQWVRITTSLTLFLLAGRTISSEDVQGVLESVREMLQDVFVRGRHHIELHRRPSFSLRLLNIKTKQDAEENNEKNQSAEKDTNDGMKKPTYSDSNTQTTVHFSPDTSIDSERTTHLEQNDGTEPTPKSPEPEPTETVNVPKKDLEKSSSPSKGIQNTEIQHHDDNSELPNIDNRQNDLDEAHFEDSSEQSNRENNEKEHGHTETEDKKNSDQANTENKEEDHCQYNEQQCY